MPTGIYNHKPHSEEHKRNIGLAMTGGKNPAKRLDVRDKMSKSKIGNKNPKWVGGVGMTYHIRARKIIEKQIGRKLRFEEKVHHLDGNIRNNSNDNLYLFSANKKHCRYHMFLRSCVKEVLNVKKFN